MKYRSLIFLLISCLLTSCVAVVVASVASGMIVYDRRSLSVLESDARIFHIVHTKIVNNPRFQQSRISVVSFNQVVLLVGQVSNASLRTDAEKIARSTPGVRRVYDEVTVRAPLNLSDRGRDTLLTGQVRTLMLNKKGLESGSIRIVTEDGIVYLMGIATHEQANIAVQVARQVNGVQKVVKVFQYIT